MSRHQPKGRGPHRKLRLADQIQRDLASVIQRELDMAQYGMVTLSSVELSPDYAHAKVGFTVIGGEPSRVEAALNERAGYLHSLLYKQLHIHTVPKLRFVHDAPVTEALELSRLIDQAAALSRAGSNAAPTDQTLEGEAAPLEVAKSSAASAPKGVEAIGPSVESDDPHRAS